MRSVIAKIASAVLLAAAPLTAAPHDAAAQTLTQALMEAYSYYPEINVARSNLRAVDEGIAIARSGNRPQLSALIRQSLDTTRRLTIGGNSGSNASPTTFSITLSQPLFAGFTTRNSIRAAEAAVRAQRQSLINTEQTVLLNTVTAFFDVILQRQVVTLQRNNVSFLGEQIRAARDRFEVGEGTRTDISQAEARQAQAQAELNASVATLRAAEASYRQFTGQQPGTLRDNIREERLLPRTLRAAVEVGQNHHPAILANLHSVDQAIFDVAVAEGALLPSVDLTGTASSAFNGQFGAEQTDNATVRLDLSIPIYQGGAASASIRQAKETLGSARITVDLSRDQVRQFTVASWARHEAAVRSIQAARTGVFAAQLALQGVIEEQRVGQRTTLDVLDAQGELITAQITLVLAERDQMVAAFTLLSSIGKLTAQSLGLQVAFYRPEEHTDAVRDKWFGLRTPDGR